MLKANPCYKPIIETITIDDDNHNNHIPKGVSLANDIATRKTANQKIKNTQLHKRLTAADAYIKINVKPSYADVTKAKVIPKTNYATTQHERHKITWDRRNIIKQEPTYAEILKTKEKTNAIEPNVKSMDLKTDNSKPKTTESVQKLTYADAVRLNVKTIAIKPTSKLPYKKTIQYEK